MPSLRKDLRSQLEKTVLRAREIAEQGAHEALSSLGVDQPKAFDHLKPDQRKLRNQLRARGRQANDSLDERGRQALDHLSAVVGYEHWHRMLFARFLAENGQLLEPEHQVPVSLADVEELARDEKMDNWELAGRFAQRMLPEVFRADLPAPCPKSGKFCVYVHRCSDYSFYIGQTDDFHRRLTEHRQGKVSWTAPRLPIEPIHWEVFPTREKAVAREQKLKTGFGRQWLKREYEKGNLAATARQTGDPVLALPLARETRTHLEKLVADLPREVFLADDSLGWTYQFWQTQRKEDVNKSGVKIGAAEISPVTQLFTEDYMVEFLLHNTLGAWWAGKVMGRDGSPQPSASADEAEVRRMVSLPAKNGLPAVEWTYLRFIQNKKTKTWTPAAGTFAGWPKHAREIRFLDPCMGSGHFAVFALPLLARLRMEEGKLGGAEAVYATLRDNIYGLELDERCTQIAAFNLALTAWKLAGHQALPALHLACSGLAPNAPEKEWVALAGNDEKLQRGMERLYRLFKNAPILGSLINPRAGEGDLLVAAFHELQPLLEKALAQETKDDTAHEMAVTAHGLAKAAEILAGQFTLVATNVPYVGFKKQHPTLSDYTQKYADDAKHNLATVFVQRCLDFASSSCTSAVVTQQNFLFLGSYKKFRVRLLETTSFQMIASLGAKAFITPMWDFSVCLAILSKGVPQTDGHICGIDAGSVSSIKAKRGQLRNSACQIALHKMQKANPDCRITFSNSSGERLEKYAFAMRGIVAGDLDFWNRSFWEMPISGSHWRMLQTTFKDQKDYAGRSLAINWATQGEGMLRPGYKNRAYGCNGVAVCRMGEIKASLYSGDLYDQNVATVVPISPEHLPAIWSYCRSKQYEADLREIDQKLNITNATLVKVPFDLAHWQKVAAEKYPHGLPQPYSSDETQWLFNGHPAGADQPLQVAVARLLGYLWPRQTGSSFHDCPALKADGLEKHADEDGIVCLSPVRGERGGTERLRTLLSTALGSYDEQSLITATDSKAKSLEIWLRDDFFTQHCALFHHRPFIWHIWDGLTDGFHALVNYHRLAAPSGAGRKLLETLTFSHLGDWIRRQQDGLKRNEAGAEDRLIAAQALQKELEAILTGEPPYDIFVRWKPLHQQPIGWEPDINDGVRMNIRPFLLANDVARKGAGILRAKPNVKWDKDRGTKPHRPKADFPWFWSWDEETEDFTGGKEFNGNRWNACHYTPNTKRAARDRQKPTK